MCLNNKQSKNFAQCKCNFHDKICRNFWREAIFIVQNQHINV